MNTAALPPLRLHRNWLCDRNAPYGAAQRAVIDTATRKRALDTISAWPGYVPTPLVELPSMARKLGVGRIRLKHEGRRFTLKSFKALGGAYGVMRILERETGAAIDDIMAGNVAAGKEFRDLLKENDLMLYGQTVQPQKPPLAPKEPKLGKKEQALLAAQQPDIGSTLGELMARRQGGLN